MVVVPRDAPLKAFRYGASFAVINEAFSTQVCSECKSTRGPKGIADLGMRQWTCSDCGALHDRDVNAARNVLVFAGAERRPLAGEISALRAGKTLTSTLEASQTRTDRLVTGGRDEAIRFQEKACRRQRKTPA
ncbi:MAG: transposase [Bradyrhizobium sp.]|nr:transposase [Bradyrhizobium sp.]